jgi:hypothetical protein
MKSSAPRHHVAIDSTVPQVTVSAVRFRPQPLPRKTRDSVGRSVGFGRRRRLFFIKWPEHVWARKLQLARQMVADVRAHIEALP